MELCLSSNVLTGALPSTFEFRNYSQMLVHSAAADSCMLVRRQQRASQAMMHTISGSFMAQVDVHIEERH